MRAATYTVGEGECAVFYFGAGQGGGVQANIDRWIGQFEPEGKPVTAKRTINGLAVTTIDVSAEHQRAARTSYAEAGIAPQRTRVITGAAVDVLPRMTDGAYDLVLVDADKDSYPVYVEHAIRLLRPGGVLVVDNMLWHDQVADPAARDATTTTLRDLGKWLRDHDDLVTALLPVSDGVLVAVRR